MSRPSSRGPERIIVVSDLHLAVADAGGFAEDHAFASLLSHLAADAIDTELVLAGDVFDLLLDPNYTEFSAELAIPRIARVLDAHPDVVASLREFGARSGNSITLLSGNHDPEVLLPAVRQYLRGELRLAHLEREIVLADSTQYPAVYGRAVGPRDAPIWIVHGDRWDPDNYIDRAALLSSGHMELPLGSKLVVEVLRGLRQGGYEWIYWLKPELAAVVPLLLYLDPMRTWACLRAHSGLTTKLLINQIRTLVRATGLFEDVRTPEHRTSPWLLDLAESVGSEPIDSLLAGLQQALEGGHPPVREDALAGHDGLRKWLIRAWLTGVRRSDRFQDIDGPDPVRSRALGVLSPSVQALVVGHTHGARSFEGPVYINTGTWLPVVGVPEGPIDTVIDAIERGELRGEAPRSYAEISLGATPKLALRRCDADGRPIDSADQ